MNAWASRVRKSPAWRRRAGVLVVAMVVLLVLTLLGGELVRTIVMAHRRSEQQNRETQALWLAESGIDRALARLQADAEYKGETWQPKLEDANTAAEAENSSKVVIAIETVDGSRRVRVEALHPDRPTDRVSVERVHPLPPAQEESP